MPGDSYAPIDQLTLDRAQCSCSVSWCHECDKITLSERTGKFEFMKLKLFVHFRIFETLPSSPSSSSSSACVLYILPSLTSLPWVLRETCTL